MPDYLKMTYVVKRYKHNYGLYSVDYEFRVFKSPVSCLKI